MGSADIIPGVSGGTVALITGIYEELLSAIKSVNLLFIVYFFRGFADASYFKKAKENFLQIQFGFLVPILVGIALAFVVLANVIGWVLDVYPGYTYAFFFGLILASAGVLLSHFLKERTVSFVVFTLFGIIVGFFIVGLNALQTTHTYVIVFGAGMITICAMILPGISGAFILLFLGQYDFMLGVLRGLVHFDFSRLPFAVVYIVGGVVGLLLFSRVLSLLLRRYRVATLSFLVGLMLGALRKPADEIIAQPGNVFLIVLACLFGVVLVVTLSLLKSCFVGSDGSVDV